jgi:hypothetical protein
MQFPVWQPVRTLIAGILVVIFALPSNSAAQIHVVSPGELQKETLAASQARGRNLQTVTQFLFSERAQKTLKSAHIDPTQVKAAVSTLSDEELAHLASRSAKAQADFAAGRLEDRDLLLIIVAIAALVLVIVAVR